MQLDLNPKISVKVLTAIETCDGDHILSYLGCRAQTDEITRIIIECDLAPVASELARDTKIESLARHSLEYEDHQLPKIVFRL
jgi:hypothetical protein